MANVFPIISGNESIVDRISHPTKLKLLLLVGLVIKPSGCEIKIYYESMANGMAIDGFVPTVARSSPAMLWSMWDWWVLIFHAELF